MEMLVLMLKGKAQSKKHLAVVIFTFSFMEKLTFSLHYQLMELYVPNKQLFTLLRSKPKLLLNVNQNQLRN